MSINLTDELLSKTKKGKIASAKQVFLEGDQENLQQIGYKTHQLEDAIKDITVTGGASTANAVSYNNETSGMTAVTAQGAIDELATKNKEQDAIIETKAEKAEVTAELEKKFDKESILQESGEAEDKVMSQKAVSDKLSDLSSSVSTLVLSCRYRGNITKDGNTIKLGVGYIYLYTTKGNYSVEITEEKVFENIVQNNMFIVVDTANHNQIITRNESSLSDNKLNKLTDIPLLYWENDIVYGCLANCIIANNVDVNSKNINTISNNINTISNNINTISNNVDDVIIKDRIISVQKGNTVTLRYKADIPAKYISKDILYMSILSSDNDISIGIAVYDENDKSTYFSLRLADKNVLKIPLEKKYKKYSIYVDTNSEEAKDVTVSVIFGFNTYIGYLNSKNIEAISKNVDNVIRACRYRGNVIKDGNTIKLGVGYIYLYTIKGNYSIEITEEKVFENIVHDNMFIVVDTANNNQITTRNEGTGSDNTLNKLTDIPLLYWDSNVVYGCLANYLISKNVDTISKNVDIISKNVNTISKNVDIISKNVNTISKNVDTIATVRNKTITIKKGEEITLAYKSVIPSSYIEDNILYVTFVTDTKDITALFTLYEEDETMTRNYSISFDKTNTIAIPLEGKYKKYSIYIVTKSEEQIVTSIKVMLGRNSYMISSFDDKTNVIENNFVSLPSNIKEEIGLTFKRFSSWNAGKDKIVFPVFTDIHAGTNFNKIKQLKNLIDNFNQFGFDFYANLGDIGIDVAYEISGLDKSYELLNYIADVSNTANAPVLFVNGNHETTVRELPTNVRKEYLNKPQERRWNGLKYVENGNNGTYLNIEKGLKVIMLDNYSMSNTEESSYLTYEGIDKDQLSWFINELTKAKDIENIVVLEHCFPLYKGNWKHKKEESGQTIYEDPAANDNYCPSRASIRNTIIAFNKRQAGTDSIYSDVSYDFTNATGTICGLFCGHSHFDVQHQEDGLLLVGHQSMGELNLENEMPSWGIYSEFNKLTETLIDIVSICPSTRQIKIFRVGAGGEERDREFSY